MAESKATTTFGDRSSAEEVLAGHDLRGRTVIVTGANTGIGEATAGALAAAGARVIYACRQKHTAEAAMARVRAAHPDCTMSFAELDLASFASIRQFSERLEVDRIDALVCNAGLAGMRYSETEEGFERTVGVCHIGHFLLTRLLMPRLLAATAPRIVMVSSTSHKQPPTLDFSKLPMSKSDFKGMTAYGQAKLCNVLMAKSLQRRYGPRGLTACALHPGTLVTTDIGRDSALLGLLMKLISPFTKNPSQGAATSVWAVVHEPATDIAGQYLKDCHVARSSAESNDSAVADRLWECSEGWVVEAGAVPDWP